MLKKLLKYDLKWLFKPLSIFYILAIFFSITTRIIESLNESLVILVIDKICTGVVIAMIINIIINCFMRNWARFIRNIYKDESYLTHTLPVSKNQIYLSKVLTMIITLFISLIIIIICLAIVFLNKDTWLIIKNILEQSAILFDSSVFSLVLTMVIMLFFEFLYIMITGTLGIIIGHKSNDLKIIKSIIYGFLLYIGLSLLSLGIVYIISLFNKNMLDIFTSVTINSSILKSVMIIIIIIYAIYNLTLYIISNKLLNKGVNID